MRVRKKFLSLLLVAVLLCAALPLNVSAEGDFPTVLAKTKKGVVQIYGMCEDCRFSPSWVGTGFAVGKEGEDSDVFLTNWHVVTCEDGNGRCKVRIWILQENCGFNEYTGEPDPDKSIACEVLKTTTGYPDYAIIRATEPISGYKALPLLESEKVQDGTTVYALGYPAEVGEASTNHFGIDDITATNGIVSQHMEFALAGDTWVLMHTAKISGGNSGGPLITENGAVVGLNTYGFGETNDRYCAVYIDYAIKGLDELGIQFDRYGEEAAEPEATGEPEASEEANGSEEETGEETNTESEKSILEDIPVAAYGLLVLVAIGGLAGFLLHQKNQKAERRLQEAIKRQEEESRERENRRFLEEQKRQEAERRYQEEQRRQAQAVKASLRLSGGGVYPISAAGGTIGREKSCTIVMPDNAAGVSRIHCRLEFRGEQLVLRDMNSTYGTFIHGKRIPPNTPVALKTGSSFSLGSEKYTFTVC